MSEMLTSLWRGQIRTPGDSVRECIERAAKNHDVTADEIKAGNELRARKFTRARHEACWRLRDLTWPDGEPRLSFPRIAQIVGLKDHTSAMNAVRRHQERLDAQQPHVTWAAE